MKDDLKMAEVRSYDFVKNYFNDPLVLVAAIKKYHEMSRVPKGEYTLLDCCFRKIIVQKSRITACDYLREGRRL